MVPSHYPKSNPIDGINELCHNSSTILHLNIRECNQLTDSSICNIIRFCPHLESLDVTYCPITSETMLSLQKNPILSTFHLFPYIYFSIETLKLGWCSLLPEDSLAETLSKLTNLQSLDVSWRSLEPVTLAQLSKYCTNLATLDISSNEFSRKFHLP